MPSLRVTQDCQPQQQHNGLHAISHKRFLTVMAARCNDKQAPVMRHDTGGEMKKRLDTAVDKENTKS